MFVIVYLILPSGKSGNDHPIRMDPQPYTPMYSSQPPPLRLHIPCLLALVMPDLLAKKRSTSFTQRLYGPLIFFNFIDCECSRWQWCMTGTSAISSPLLYANKGVQQGVLLLMAGFTVGNDRYFDTHDISICLYASGTNVIIHADSTSSSVALIHGQWIGIIHFFGCVELTSFLGVFVSYCFIILAVWRSHFCSLWRF